MKQNFPKVTNFIPKMTSKNGFQIPEMLKQMLEKKGQQSTWLIVRRKILAVTLPRISFVNHTMCSIWWPCA